MQINDGIRQSSPRLPHRANRDSLKSTSFTSKSYKRVRAAAQFERNNYILPFGPLLSAAKLQKDWDSYSADAPTPLAINAAERALEILRHLNAEPAAVLPSADGGVGICFNNGGKYGQLEFLNNGEAHALLYGGVDGPQAWQIDLTEPDAMREAWKRVRAYL